MVCYHDSQNFKITLYSLKTDLDVRLVYNSLSTIFEGLRRTEISIYESGSVTDLLGSRMGRFILLNGGVNYVCESPGSVCGSV